MTTEDMYSLLAEQSKNVYGTRIVPNEEYDLVVNPYECIIDKLRELELKANAVDGLLNEREKLIEVLKYGRVAHEHYHHSIPVGLIAAVEACSNIDINNEEKHEAPQ